MWSKGDAGQETKMKIKTLNESQADELASLDDSEGDWLDALSDGRVQNAMVSRCTIGAMVEIARQIMLLRHTIEQKD